MIARYLTVALLLSQNQQAPSSVGGPCDAWKPAVERLNDLIAGGLATAADLDAGQASEARCRAYHPGDPLPAWVRELARLPAPTIQAQQTCAEVQELLDSQRRQTGPQLQQTMRRQGQVPDYLEDSDTHLAKCIEKRLGALASATANEIQTLVDGAKARHDATVEAARAVEAVQAAVRSGRPAVAAWSAILCNETAAKKEAKADIDQEHHYARVGGGIVDMEKLHDDQDRMRLADQWLAAAKAGLRRLKAKQEGCGAPMVQAALQCVPSVIEQNVDPRQIPPCNSPEMQAGLGDVLEHGPQE